MDYLYAIMTVVAGFLLVTTLVTGAFFSRPIGTKLGGAGVAAAALAIWGGIEYGLPWWMALLPGLLLLLNGFVGLAALGGEK